MKIIALIPARMGSSRFPGKPLEKINKKPMIGHVYENVKKCKLLDHVVVATCDEEIKEYIESIGGVAVMTSKSHERASDRCAEAMLKIEKSLETKFDIAVMVQGDEPMVHPDMITEALSPFETNTDVQIVNLVGKIKSDEEFNDRNCIKVVCDTQSNALYFSREPIPTIRNPEDQITKNKQICIIPFRREFLIKFNDMSPTPLEEIESVDMMRVLENGFKVKMVPTKYETYAVDTIQDLRKVEKLMFPETVTPE